MIFSKINEYSIIMKAPKKQKTPINMVKLIGNFGNFAGR
jgi:hypothetical protein